MAYPIHSDISVPVDPRLQGRPGRTTDPINWQWDPIRGVWYDPVTGATRGGGAVGGEAPRGDTGGPTTERPPGSVPPVIPGGGGVRDPIQNPPPDYVPPGGRGVPPPAETPGSMEDLLEQILRGIGSGSAPWLPGGYGEEVWNQIGPGGLPGRPEAWVPAEEYQIEDWKAPGIMPTSWEIRQMARPAAEAEAMSQSRALMESMRGMREMGGPGVSGAALRQAALGNIAGAGATAQARASEQLLSAKTEMAGFSQEAWSTKVEQQRAAWEGEQSRRFGAWSAELGAWTEEFKTRAAVGEGLYGTWMDFLPKWMDKIFAYLKYKDDQGEEGTEGTFQEGDKAVAVDDEDFEESGVYWEISPGVWVDASGRVVKRE